ncbi:ABC transporter G family member 31-like isoform X1 [Magnolia sinica]|uniref:ABC transporter G family member 31-like isoform X1 n=2 Tax=Magnolia sinica TaxID=86752 RepID=UPI00265A03B7|nr:ABC transporter G family member 31-like isoform X1 [Magnolia sinica]
MWNSSENLFSRSNSSKEIEDDEETLRWAALERLPTYNRVSRGIFRSAGGDSTEVEIGNLKPHERKLVLDRLFNAAGEDAGQLLHRMRKRFDAVDLKFPKIEVRFQQLKADAYVHIGSRALPTVPNVVFNMTEVFLRQFKIFPGRRKRLSILNNISGIIRPARMTLLLGPPSSGKTTLLLAIAGRPGPGLEMSGSIMYNGHGLKEFVPQKTTAYVSQQDWLVPEMTVRETFEFAARCQGVGIKYDMLLELSRREKNAGIKPDVDLDIFMKALSLGGEKTGLVVEYIMKGPRAAALDFFAFMGFKCPERKNVADFLQEVTSEKDQWQYWSVPDRPYQYITVAKFAKAFHSCTIGKSLSQELSVPFDRLSDYPAALSMSNYGVSRAELLKASFSWQMLLMKRNSFISVFKFMQLLFVALMTTTVFFRTNMHHKTVEDGVVYLGAMYLATIVVLFNGFTEAALLMAKLPVLYKHRDSHFYPCWIYSLPSWVLSVPTSLVESGIWVVVTYYAIGFDPLITRFLRHFLLFFILHQMSLPFFRLLASLGRNMIVANTIGSFALLVVMVLGGFILSRDSIPSWWIWGYWFSPLMYAQNAVSVNEFLGHSWHKKASNYTNVSLGEMVLKARGLFTEGYWYWIGVGALLGYTVIFNILLTFALTWLNPLGKKQAVVSKEELQGRDPKRKEGVNGNGQRGMVLPFQPLSMCFSNINYYVDLPVELRKQGILEDRLQLLVNVTGAFRPGVLTALVGVSGAGKTTLMDVLAGRKTGGLVEGSITISGYPKNQETFARIAGYCEQDDIHSPCITVYESILYSAWLRLPSDVDLETQRVFVEEVMELVELTSLSGAIIGLPGVDGLSTEQRKRLTIAVELVANPSIVFMDEPTSGLDARAAAIVMRTVRNIADTGRTIVCTIHQPSIDIFESFDELLFMKCGGELIYSGPVGTNSHKLVEYFEMVEGVPKIKAGYNPAAWILEVTSTEQESRLGVDFAEVYRRSNLFQQNRALVEILSKPNNDSEDLSFPTKYSQPFLVQFIACLWKQNLSYWRNPQYTAVRLFYTIIVSLMVGTIYWRFGSKREMQQDFLNAMGSMYVAVIFVGLTNAIAVMPVVFIERLVSYRERAAGMYSALPFAFAQVAIEFPYVFVQTLIFGSLFYSMASFEWALWKFIWYLFFMYFTLLYCTFFGMMCGAITPNQHMAPIVASPFYMMWNLFCGFIITRKSLPVWWRWFYWANPVAWSLYGLLTSQYGDIDKPMKLWDGLHSVSVRKFLEDHFGFRRDFLGIAGVMVVSFCVMFALIFAFSIKYLKFQRR